MKSVVVVLCFIGAISAQEKLPDCGAYPEKKLEECCGGIEKFIQPQFWGACEGECQHPDMCCKVNCFADKLGIVKDGRFDKDTALGALAATLGDDATWTPIYTQAVETCIADVPQMKENFMKIPDFAKCDTTENAMFAICLKKELLMNCPKATADPECDKIKGFLNCILPK
ncbi:CLUMA_CG017963, isoform A [Clunio marinus]|uniref:CLUMA_CG017963, isoform A n=1 Tax=Clunio marinus TaxID=568069 RepID=A0A1J1J1Z8_9DIPT|nr:CLUMA_CG017963, isoform A [Clunio marinus]